MKSCELGVVAMCAAVGTWLTPDAARANLLVGTGWPQGILYDINASTGEASHPRSTGLRRIVGITYGDDGYLYGLAGRTPNLYRIDPESGASEFVANTGRSLLVEGDLDFDPISGNLYTVQTGVRGARTTRDLVMVALADGDRRVVGTIAGSGDSSAMAFSPAGELFVLDTAGDRLLNLDPASAEVRASVALDVPLGSVAGMDFDPVSGLLFVADGSQGGTDSLYTLDPTTGEMDLIGSTGLRKGLGGLQFVPEPASLILVALGGAGMLLRRRL